MGQRYLHLCAEERGVIMAMKTRGESIRAIATALSRSPSTVSRELRRNGYRAAHECAWIGRPRIAGGYDALRAGQRARRLQRTARRGRKLAREGRLWTLVHGQLQQGWSPQQIAGRLKRHYPGCRQLHVSHETIYTAIYAAPRGTLRRELIALLRQHRGARRPRTGGTDRRGKLQDMVSIHLRPPEANERLVPGHWEGDLIKGRRASSAVGTLVDRSSLFVLLVRMPNSTAQAALEGFRAAFAPLPPELRKTLTYDQGKEMAKHLELSLQTGLKIFFADPHSPWQRGINENTNGLLRQYLPKGADLSQYSQRDLDRIAWQLNTRPRKTLGFRTPAEVFLERCCQRQIATSLGVALGP
jgi:IS30 family transposase